MSAEVRVRPHEVGSAPKNRRVGQGRRGERRIRDPRVAPPATQRVSRRRPGGVRGPRVDNPVQMQGRRSATAATSAMVGTGVRLTDRGLAVAMAVTIALVIAAVVCITTTAARVTAEPASASIAASSRPGDAAPSRIMEKWLDPAI